MLRDFGFVQTIACKPVMHLHQTLRHALALCCIALALVGCQAKPSAHSEQPTVTTLIKDTQSWDGTTLPAYPDGQPEVTILRIIVPPHSKLPIHKHPGINAGILLTGKIVVHKHDGTTQTVHAGEALIEMVETWHFGENPTDEDAEIVVFYAGIVGKDITVPKNKQDHSH